jgi:hypothetical protein
LLVQILNLVQVYVRVHVFKGRVFGGAEYVGYETYSEVEHAGLLCGAEVLALSDFGVCVELEVDVLAGIFAELYAKAFMSVG